MSDATGKVAVYDWGADGLKRKVSIANDPTAGFTYLGSLVYTPSGSSVYTIESASFPEGRFVKTTNGFEVNYHIKDHLGSVRATMNQNGVLSNQSDYYPFGERWSASGEATTNRYLFSGKEKQTAGDLQGMNLLDFGARMYDPEIPRWLTNDPLAERIYSVSQYVYCKNNPVRFVDPDGKREWPVNDKYKDFSAKRHSNDYGEDRKTHTHKGVDINYNAGSDGNADKGAPILATHDGKVTRVASIDQGDMDGGGNRVQITSKDGKVATYYMHLDEIDGSIKLGVTVSEGQQIGTMGGSGKGSKTKYVSHLHYELIIDGKKVNPAKDATRLIDPQKIIDHDETQTEKKKPEDTSKKDEDKQKK